MSVHQCPKCELRYSLRTELDYHLREEHPTFRHDYPAAWAHPEDREQSAGPEAPSAAPPGGRSHDHVV